VGGGGVVTFSRFINSILVGLLSVLEYDCVRRTDWCANVAGISNARDEMICGVIFVCHVVSCCIFHPDL